MKSLRDALRINTAQGKVLKALEERRKRERELFDS
jgi:GH24 family phage-related lysozyme (muramidase)